MTPPIKQGQFNYIPKVYDSLCPRSFEIEAECLKKILPVTTYGKNLREIYLTEACFCQSNKGF